MVIGKEPQKDCWSTVKVHKSIKKKNWEITGKVPERYQGSTHKAQESTKKSIKK